jgi:hypothetical protein
MLHFCAASKQIWQVEGHRSVFGNLPSKSGGVIHNTWRTSVLARKSAGKPW